MTRKHPSFTAERAVVKCVGVADDTTLAYRANFRKVAVDIAPPVDDDAIVVFVVVVVVAVVAAAILLLSMCGRSDGIIMERADNTDNIDTIRRASLSCVSSMEACLRPLPLLPPLPWERARDTSPRDE